MRSEAQKRADQKYKAKAYDQTRFETRREIHINERINQAASQQGVSKNAYIVAAVERQLEADGFGRESLPAEKDPM